MGYSAISFSAGEQPTTAKWNILGSNDASFNDGTGIGANAIAAASLATNAIKIGYASITGAVTTASATPVQATGLTITVTIPAGGRSIKITAFSRALFCTGSTGSAFMSIWDGVVNSGTRLSEVAGFSNTGASVGMCMAIVTPSAGSKTYNVGFNTNGAGTASIDAGAAFPAFILVEVI